MKLHIAVAGLRALAVPLAVAAVLSMFTYALTAGNVVPTSNVGSGVKAVEGYTVTNVGYDLNDDTPQNVDSVTFTISPAPPAGTEFRAKLLSSATAFYTCSAAGANVTCNTTNPQAKTADANELTVIVG